MYCSSEEGLSTVHFLWTFTYTTIAPTYSRIQYLFLKISKQKVEKCTIMSFAMNVRLSKNSRISENIFVTSDIMLFFLIYVAIIKTVKIGKHQVKFYMNTTMLFCLKQERISRIIA
jgi:hypothetical protein